MEKSSLGPVTVCCWNSSHKYTAPEAALERQTCSGGGSSCVLQTPVTLTLLLCSILPVWQVICLLQCMTQAQGSLVKDFAMCCIVYRLQWKECICKIFYCVVLSPSPNSLIHEESVDSCAFGAGKNHGAIPAHSTAWTWRSTMLACSQHIPGCGIEQGSNFCLFNKQIEKSQGLFCKL